MAVLTTYAIVSPLSNLPSAPDWSAQLSTFAAVDNSPPVPQHDSSSSRYGAVTSNLPVSEVAQSFTATRAPSFLDDFYFRVHIRPGVIDLGNLLSAQSRDIEVWSAYFEPQLLSSIDQSGTDGITLGQPSAPPTSFASLEARTYTLSVSTNGSPVIDALYTFNFALDIPTLSVTGRRVVVWPWMPQTTHKEALAWQTDILPSFNNEQRLALRAAPRQEFSYEFQLDSYQFSKAKAIATQWAHRVYGIPVWAELTRVGAISAGATQILIDTSNADYREDDVILIWESDTKFVAAENTTVLSDRINLKLPLEASYSNAYVAPIRFARTFQGMQFKRSAQEVVVASATFQVSKNKDLGASVGFATYRGKDVLTDRSVLVGDMSERISRSIDVMDNGSGPVVVDVQSSWVDSTMYITFDTLDRAARWKARKWIHSRRGKQKAFWLPTWNPDLILLGDVGSSSAAITVRPIGYPLYYGVKDIMFQLKNGTQVFSRVLGGSTDVDGNEVLSLSGPVGTSFTVADVDFVCFISHVRFNSDNVEIRHSNAGRAIISIPVTETPE